MLYNLSETDTGAVDRGSAIQVLLHAVRAQAVKSRFLAIEHLVDKLLACDVLNLSTTQVELVRKGIGSSAVKAAYHGLPYALLCCHIGFMELHLIYKAAFKGTVHVGSKVGGCNENAIEFLNLLKDNVLHGILHLVDTAFGIGAALVYYGIGLVEQQDGLDIALLAIGTVTVEHGTDVLLTVTYPLALDVCDIHLHYVTPCSARQLQYGLGLAGTGCAIEEACETASHTALLHALLDAEEILVLQHLAKLAYRDILLTIVEEVLLLYALESHQPLSVVLLGFLPSESQFTVYVLAHLLRDGNTVARRKPFNDSIAQQVLLEQLTAA